jgi:uncharacterized protein (DUF983 family)
MAETSKTWAMLHAKCPRCRRGNMFKGSLYGLSFQRANEHCPHCGVRFEIEPGYFYVAMYISYALNVAEGVTLGVATYILTGEMENYWLYIGIVLMGCLLLAPINFRYSRVILLHLMTSKIKYQPHLDTDDSQINPGLSSRP